MLSYLVAHQRKAMYRLPTTYGVSLWRMALLNGLRLLLSLMRSMVAQATEPAEMSLTFRGAII